MSSAAIASNLFHHDLARADSGEATPLMLVHGFPLDGRVWLDCAGELRKLHPSRRLIVPDLAGFGRSVLRSAFTMASLADDVVVLARSLGIERFAIAGLSMGGYVALTLAKRHPSVLAGVLMVDSKMAADDEAGRAGRDRMAATARANGSGPVADAMMPKMLHPDAYAGRRGLVASLDQIMRSQSPETIANACEAMRDRDDFASLVPALPMPFGAVVGAGDAIAPPALASTMVSTRGTLFVVEGAGHLAPFEQPAATARAIDAFLHQHQL
jgi:3-oxoadipate enol-lactonase